MPELSINLTAVRKRNISLAIGDIVGSIITNLTLILGTVSIINPVMLGSDMVFVLLSLIVVNMIFLVLASRMKFGMKQGTLLLVVYSSYLILLFSIGVGL